MVQYDKLFAWWLDCIVLLKTEENFVEERVAKGE